MSEPCHVLFHPALLARRAREIAESQQSKIERDARGRPFILAAAPLPPAPAPAAPPEEPGADMAMVELPRPTRFAWLISQLRPWRPR